MKIIKQGLLGAVVTASIFSISFSASAFSIVLGNRDTENVRTDFINSFDTNTSSTVIDDGTNFGIAPNTGSVASVNRTGTIGTESFNYTIYDVDFSDSPNGLITPGSAGDDIYELDNITVDIPAGQQGANGLYSWGVDSGAGGGNKSTPNTALFDFTNNSIGHFGIDLHDFEAGDGISASNFTSGASGEIRLYKAGSLIDSYTLQFPGVDGGGSTDNPANSEKNDSKYKGYGNRQSMFVGISADDPSEFFDQVAFVVGDDDVDTVGIATSVNDGSTERWAADGFTFGTAYRSVPFEFSPTLGLFLIGGFWVKHKLKHKLNR